MTNHCFSAAETDLQWLDDTWKMAKDFNDAFKMKSWVIHYEVSIKTNSFIELSIFKINFVYPECKVFNY